MLDFTQFHAKLDIISKDIQVLQTINRDVLIGKRNTNCISCGDQFYNKNNTPNE